MARASRLQQRDGVTGASAYSVAVALVAILAIERCDAAWSQPMPATIPAERRALPAPRRAGGAALATVLATRRSMRAFARRALADDELGQLLWAAQGITDGPDGHGGHGGHRTAPSAGALYPLAVRVLDARSLWRYLPAAHALVRESAIVTRAALAAACHGQDFLRTAPAIFVITADLAVTARRYGERAERFAALEAGHAAENLLLTATALGLAAVPVGAFEDDRLRRVLGLADRETPLYVIPVGASP